MKRIILIVLLNCLIYSNSSSQTLIGDIPSGGSVDTPNIKLSAYADWESRKDSIDINCDGVADMEWILYRGQTSMDAPNTLYLKPLNDSLRICSEEVVCGQKHRETILYKINDTLLADGDEYWARESIYMVGLFASMMCDGTEQADSVYIAFQLSGKKGWVKISFDLQDYVANNPIVLNISEATILCNPSSINLPQMQSCLVFPNPTKDGRIYIEPRIIVTRVNVFDVTGKKVSTVLAANEFNLPLTPGLYFLQIVDDTKQSYHVKVIRD